MRKTFDIKHVITIEHRAQKIIIENEENTTEIWNVYAPADVGRIQTNFYKKLRRLIKPERDRKIICGDFNTVYDKRDVKFTENFKITAAAKIWLDTSKQNGLLDIFRSRNPFKRIFTLKKSQQERRIDRIYCSKEIQMEIQEFLYRINTMSDHLYIGTITIRKKNRNKWGQGLWKNNLDLYNNRSIKSEIEELYNLYADQKQTCGHITKWWDEIKLKVKELLVRKGKELNTENKNRHRELSDNLNNAKVNTREYKLIIAELQEIEQKDYRKSQILTKTTDLRQNEKPSKEFFTRLRAQLDKQNLEQVTNERGDLLTNEKEITREVTKFYENLWNKETSIDKERQQGFVNEIKGLKISDEKREILNSPINESEIKEAITDLQTGKSPGSDGLSAEFYKIFWPTIKRELIEVLNNAFLFGQPCTSWSIGMVKIAILKT